MSDNDTLPQKCDSTSNFAHGALACVRGHGHTGPHITVIEGRSWYWGDEPSEIGEAIEHLAKIAEDPYYMEHQP